MNNILNKNSPDIQKIMEQMDKMGSKLDELFKDYKPLLNNERYIPEKQLTKILNVCDRTLLDYRTRGILPYIKNEKKIMYKESDVVNMLNKMYINAWNL